MLTFFALFLGDMSSTLEVIESEDVLKLSFVVYNGPTSLLFALLQEVNQELLDILWLFIANNGCQVL